MIRNPFFDAYAGAFMALGGPMGLLLPHRIMLAMLTPDLAVAPARATPADPAAPPPGRG